MECEAENVMRKRAEPCGTVGGRMAGTQMPRFHNASLTRSASAFARARAAGSRSPTEASLPRQRGCQVPPAVDEREQVCPPLGLVADQGARLACQRAGKHRRRGSGKNVATRGLDQRLDDRTVRGDERAGDSRRLAQRCHIDDALGRETELCQRAAARIPRPAADLIAQHAETMRVVDREPRVVYFSASSSRLAARRCRRPC